MPKPDSATDKLLPTELQDLILDPKHPGINDHAYVTRRKALFDLARRYRLENLGLPGVEYTEEEHAVWRLILSQLQRAHTKYASEIYLEGKQLLNIESDHIPQLSVLDEKLRAQHQIGLVPAEGLIDTRNFFRYLSERMMPCTQYIRHSANPGYTPEPDAVHDVIGHVPPLMNKEYVDLIQLIGTAVKYADDKELLIWQHIYWFVIEFGLIEERGKVKAFGAGLLSSSGELEYCFSGKVQHRKFSLAEIINTQYDTTQMQTILFVIPSMEQLRVEIERLIKSLKRYPSA